MIIPTPNNKINSNSNELPEKRKNLEALLKERGMTLVQHVATLPLNALENSK